MDHDEPMRRLLGVVSLAVVLAPVAGCSLEAGPEPGVAPDVLAEQVSVSLAETVGRAPDDVECPDRLAARVGAEVRCTLRDGETAYGVTVRATAVDGDDVRFDIQVDQDPLP